MIMNTRSAIGYKLPTGEVRGIYCHNDGYLSFNGRMLQQNYQESGKVTEMVELGDMSSLRDQIADNVYYQRDRGEDGVDVATQSFTDVDDFVTKLAASNCQYFYLWNGNEWIVTNGNLEFDRVEDLLVLEVA